MTELTKRLLPYITIDDIPDDYKELAKEIGIENTIKVSILLGGYNTYIPKEEYFIRKTRDKMIIREFDGYNRKALAAKYSLSEKRIRDIVKGR